MEMILKLASEWIGDEAFFNIVATLVGMGWVWFQRVARLDQVKDQRFIKAKRFLEAGVAKTYQVFVKERKKAASDGKLTEEEKREAREMAFSYARSYAFDEGLNVAKELGGDLIPGFIEQAIGKLKTDCSGPQV